MPDIDLKVNLTGADAAAANVRKIADSAAAIGDTDATITVNAAGADAATESLHAVTSATAGVTSAQEALADANAAATEIEKRMAAEGYTLADANKTVETSAARTTSGLGGLSRIGGGLLGTFARLTTGWQRFVTSLRNGQMTMGGIVAFIAIFINACLTLYAWIKKLTAAKHEDANANAELAKSYDAAAEGVQSYAHQLKITDQYKAAEHAKQVRQIADEWNAAAIAAERVLQAQLEMIDAKDAQQMATLRLEEVTAIQAAPTEQKSVLQAEYAQKRNALSIAQKNNRTEREKAGLLIERDNAVAAKTQITQKKEADERDDVTLRDQKRAGVANATSDANATGTFIKYGNDYDPKTVLAMQAKRRKELEAYITEVQKDDSEISAIILQKATDELTAIDNQTTAITKLQAAKEDYDTYVKQFSENIQAAEKAIADNDEIIRKTTQKLAVIEVNKTTANIDAARETVQNTGELDKAKDAAEIAALKKQLKATPAGGDRFALAEKIALREGDATAATNAKFQQDAFSAGKEIHEKFSGFTPLPKQFGEGSKAAQQRQSQETALAQQVVANSAKLADGAQGEELGTLLNSLIEFSGRVLTLREKDAQVVRQCQIAIRNLELREKHGRN